MVALREESWLTVNGPLMSLRGTGGALIVGGIIYIATRGSTEEHAVTGWLAPGGGGLAVAGGF